MDKDPVNNLYKRVISGEITKQGMIESLQLTLFNATESGDPATINQIKRLLVAAQHPTATKATVINEFINYGKILQ